MRFESPDALKECRILIVEDTKANVDILVRALKNDYTLGVALDGQRALEFAGAEHTRPHLILLDIIMPEMDGFAVCRALKDNPETRDIPIIFITAMDDPTHKTKGFEHGAVDYITKPFEIAEVKARVKTHLTLKLAQEELRNQNTILENRVRKRTRELEETQREVIDRLSLAAEYHDMDTGQHIRRISDFCRLLGLAVGISEDQAEVLALAGSMHDVGKIGISDSILLKPGKLTPEEWAIMKTHTTIGARLLAGGRSEILQQAKIIAETHHEKWDGSGYPRGLKGRDIPLFGRISCICDVFDALISKRPYKDPWPIEKAFQEIRDGAGTHFDPDLVQLFLNLEDECREIALQGAEPDDEGGPQDERR